MIDQRLVPIKTRLDDIGKDLHNFTIEIRHDELSKTVSELRNRIQEPFMFVIVGEVKAGKSSFINALLDTGKDICAVAPSPMTDTVQQIIYGDSEEVQELNPYLKRIFLPVDILKEIAIVDTPGTNTIIDHHQEITERFIPASDLIVFVFEAKNPYRESAWKFFEFIHDDWRKKIIFVLQQKDLLPENELEINRKGLIEQADKKGMNDPLVFAVSAKDELEGRKDISGFVGVRDYIKENITGGKAAWLKLQNNITTFENILNRIAKGLDDREYQYKADVNFRNDIVTTLDEQEGISVGQVKHMVNNLLASYDAVTVKKEMEISSSLSMFSLIKRSFRAIFSKQQSLKNYLESLAASLGEDLNKELRKRLDENIADLAQSIQNMVQIVDLKIRNSENILTNDHDLFSNIAERRNNVLKDLQETFSKFLQETENFASEELFPEGTALSPNVLTGSGIAVIGVILTAVTHGMVFDITGGALTAIGLTFAGVSAGVKKRKLMKQFREEVKNGRVKLEENVTNSLTTYIASIKQKIDENFHDFDELLTKEAGELERLETEFKSITSRLKETEKELDMKK